MKRAGQAIAVLAAVAAGVAAAASVLHARDERHPLPVSEERLMYLRSGRTADRVFLSFDAIASDVYWIRTIQHYGRDLGSTRTTGRFELLNPLLDLTTTLDPHFNIAYRFGAIFLAERPPKGPGRADQAIALLEKGLASNPTRWQYLHDIGFVHYWFTNDYERAAAAFERAATMPGAPEWLRPVAAMTRAQGGDRAGARRLLTELLSADQDYVRHTAERGLQQLQALDAIDQLQTIVERYHEATGSYPRAWRDLIGAHLLRGLPIDPTKTAFVYDAATHRVTISETSSLFPLPRFLQPRAR
jgi:tetratricopeptide (TPR) repeat protein